MVFGLNNELCAVVWCLNMSAVGKVQLSGDDDSESCIPRTFL